MTNVTACIDGSSASPAVCDYAAWASLRMEAPLNFLHVLDKSEYPAQSNLSGNIGLGSREALLEELADLDEKRGKLALEQGRLMLEAARERAIEDGVADPATRQRHGDLVETLTEMEEEIRLLVIGKQGRDGDSVGEHIGSHLENVVRIMHRPILVTTPLFQEPGRVMIAFDGSATTRKGVEMVASSPLFRGLPCHVVMVGAEDADTQAELNWAKETLEAAGFEAPATILPGEVESVLCEYRKEHDIDMLIMGAYGHSRIRQFLVGSTTTSVVRSANVPVLLLR
ncbi:universal stress protein [Thiohalomonas denitrificans]|uniref:Nucleotide-binding universal stress protein, UspA family n=1 Tax=Thiohalomonas denitrificans TaxID=415747 RepID=A0A1G5QXR4_9GAMM|nr:universal stress protein [Thiohalomonas denitrificans]SCZ66633.1 Nucleotide-binding universal stress protein, UspA family [Thiohalomonas denitrificans]